MPTIYTPQSGESVRHIEMTPDEKKKHAKDFREEKEYQRELKEKRFAEIQERRKNRGSGGSGVKGINVVVDTDKK